MGKLNSHQLRDIDIESSHKERESVSRRPLFLILENIYDTYNIGGLFRLADALAVEKIFLCGETETPPNPKIMKASVGTYKIVPWEYTKTAGEAIQSVRDSSAQASSSQNLDGVPTSLKSTSFATTQKPLIVAVEQSESSVPYTEIEYVLPCALVLGNESYGVTKETLELCDKIAEIPMWGVNKSLNVIVSAAIVSYSALLAIPAKRI